MTKLNLIVLRAADLKLSLAFYQTLGLKFVEEQHGTGPIHYACVLDSGVLELFPGKPGAAPERRQAGATMIGFQVSNLDVVVAALEVAGNVITTPLQESSWGRRAVVQDPDGRAVELTSAD